jgi:glycosyl transferase family 25
VILVNLESAATRRARMTRQLEAQNVAFDRLGQDFRALERAAIARWFAARFPSIRPSPRWLSGAELGCWASHLEAWERIACSGWPAGVVLEDDLELAPAFGRSARELAGGLGDMDVVYLGTSSRNLSRRRSTALGSLRVHAPVGSIFNTWGYVVSTLWIARVLAHSPFPLQLPLDHFLGGRSRIVRPRIGVLQPPCVAEDPETAEISQIRPHTWRPDRLAVVEGARRRFLGSRAGDWFYRLYRWL